MDEITEMAISEQAKRYNDYKSYTTEFLENMCKAYEELLSLTNNTDVYIKARALRQALNDRKKATSAATNVAGEK